MIKTIFDKFWGWYEQYYKANLNIAAGVFLLQIVHLLWLSVDVVLHRMVGTPPLLNHIPGAQYVLVFVDYLEIPTIVTVSLVYIRQYQKQKDKKALLYLFMLNTQWLHIFWITDEFVESSFTGTAGTVLPPLLAWVAILIDYLEIPVIIDTLKKVRTEGKKAFIED